MKSRNLVVSFAVVFATLTGLASTVSPAAATDPQNDALTSSLEAPALIPSARSDGDLDPSGYWTEEKIREAVPLDIYVMVPDDAASASLQISGSDEGSGYIVSEPVSAIAGSELRILTDPVPSTAGRLFFRTSSGTGSCSAAAINGPTRDVVMTAGHCVHPGGTGNWYTNFMFAPSYYNGPSAQGYWYYHSVRAFNSWINGADTTHDQAFLSMQTKNGVHIVNAVGGNGLITGAGRVQNNVRVWGWPAQSPYNGEVPYYCDGNSYIVNMFSSDATINCSMNKGASGGPWVINRIDANLGYVFAITSRCEVLESKPAQCARTRLYAAPNPRDVATMFGEM